MLNSPLNTIADLKAAVQSVNPPRIVAISSGTQIQGNGFLGVSNVNVSGNNTQNFLDLISGA